MQAGSAICAGGLIDAALEAGGCREAKTILNAVLVFRTVFSLANMADSIGNAKRFIETYQDKDWDRWAKQLAGESKNYDGNVKLSDGNILGEYQKGVIENKSGTDVLKKLNDVLTNKTLTNQTKKVDNYVSSIKGNKAAKADFDAMNPTNIRTYSSGTIVGDLPDGRTINIHPSTTLSGTPSVEIYDPVTGKSIKIRY